jgi:uncharacterized metal-binding protein YceD (DUF177 family)
MATRFSPPAEFSRCIASSRVSEKAMVETIEASAVERAALAKRLNLVSLDRLTATARFIRPSGSSLIRVTGEFEAQVTQACVVTLEPVKNRIAETFTVHYSVVPLSETGEVAVDPEDEDPPEPLDRGGIDLGEAVTQQLAVALDPYPRVRGARLEETGRGRRGHDEDDELDSPFAALKALKGRHKD